MKNSEYVEQFERAAAAVDWDNTGESYHSVARLESAGHALRRRFVQVCDAYNKAVDELKNAGWTDAELKSLFEG